MTYASDLGLMVGSKIKLLRGIMSLKSLGVVTF